MTIAPTATSTNEPGTAVANRVNVALGEPQGDFDAAIRLAKALAVSNIIPDALRGKPADVLVIVLYGQELGLAPMQAMQVIDVVKGRPTLRANLWVALTRRAGHRVSVVEETATSCTVQVVRADDPTPHRVTYTLDDAKTAGLLSNDNYRKNPKDMLYARATSKCCRRACPEVALGFSDEYELSEPVAARPSLAQVAARRADEPATAVVPDDAVVAAQVAKLAADHRLPVDAEPVAEADRARLLELLAACGIESPGADPLAVLSEITVRARVDDLAPADVEFALAELERCAAADDPAVALGELRIELARERAEALDGE